jgi:phage-related protein
LKEFQKIIPAIKQSMKQAQDAFSKVDTKTMTNKLHQAVKFMRKKMQDLKRSSENNEIKIKVNNKDAQKQISQLQKKIESLQEKITARRIKLDIITPKLDKISNEPMNKVNPGRLENNKQYINLSDKEQILTEEIAHYSQQLSEAKSKMAQLGQQTSKTAATQSKLGSFFGTFKSKIEPVKAAVGRIGMAFKNVGSSIGRCLNPVNLIKKGAGAIGNIGTKAKGVGTGIKSGIGTVLKYAAALFCLRSIYSTLSGCAQSWLSSQNAGAKQLSANIDYMKNSLGNILAPTIQWITNLIYEMLKAIQSVIYALFRVNIFANASAKAYSSMANGASKANKETKSLSSIHSEINNISDNNNSSTSGGTPVPSFDLSGIDSQMSPLAQKLYDFFKPLKDSWDVYGPQVVTAFKNAISGIGEAFGAMWNSVETLFTNGTIYSIIANILNTIGEIGYAWANAWNNGNNGTEIIQGIANMINDITGAILNLVSSTGFQSFLDGVISAFSGIVQFIEPIVSGFSDMAEKILEIVFSTIGDVLKTVGDALQTIAQNETAVEILKALGGAIAIVVGAIIAWNIAQLVLNGLMGLFAIITSPITLIILGIIAAITAIILIIKNWGAISEWFGNLWKTITDKLKEIWTSVKEFFINLWQGIVDKVKSVWNGIKDFLSNLWNGILNIVRTVFNAIATFFSNIWNGIKTVVSTVWNTITSTISNVINGIRNTISNVLNAIKNVWNNIWTTIGNVVKNIWNGIWSGIKGVINSILGGIEGFVNGTIRGINKLLSGISKVANAVGSLIGLNPINLQISTISLPRLAKGGVLTEATAVVAGEYSGAKSNPEIVTPQNIMRDTFEDVLSNYSGNNNDRPIYLTVMVGNKKLGQILLDDLRDKKRRTGKDIEALVN